MGRSLSSLFQHLIGRTRQCRKIRKRVWGGIITEKKITKLSLLAGNVPGHTENSKKVTQLEIVIKLDTNAGFKINRLLKERKKSTLVVKAYYTIDNLRLGPTALRGAHKIKRFLFVLCFTLFCFLPEHLEGWGCQL